MSDLKSKIPLGKKPKDEDEESEEQDEGTEVEASSDDATGTDATASEIKEDGSQSKSLLHKLKSKIESLQKKGEKAGESGSEEAPSEADIQKKKRSRIIQVIILVGAIGFAASDYIIPTEEEAPAQPSSFKRPDRPKKKPKDSETSASKPSDETEGADKKEAAPTDVAGTTDTAPGEAPTNETTSDSPVQVSSSDASTESTGAEASSGDTAPADSVSAAGTDTPPASEEPMSTEPVTEPVAEPSSETPSEATATTETPVTPSDQSATTDSVDGNETVKDDQNITDQILEDLEKQAKTTEAPVVKKEYVAPPDYEYRGRGLVYNCAGKHWACVDAPSYKTCEDNASSVKYLQKRVECHPYNIYETVKGCESVQGRMVSSSARTEFCSN